MSSFNTTCLGTIDKENLVLFRFIGFWKFEEMTWMMGYYGFEHAEASRLYDIMPRVAQLIDDDFYPENMPIAALNGIVPVEGRDHTHLMPTLSFNKIGVTHINVPFYKGEGASGWSFLGCQKVS